MRLNDNMFEIVGLLGEGGLSKVYRGFNVRTGGRVAIKFIDPYKLRDLDAMALFRREAEILSTLHHEAIVGYNTYGYASSVGREYLVMELVEGASLKKRLESGPLSFEETMQLKTRIAGGLEAAHLRKVVHRDVSPDNIILPGGDVRAAKIIDFGIAKARGTTEGTVIGDGFAGKYLYASPEQVAEREVTFKSDIYSFGLVLAEAIRGAPLDMGGKLDELFAKRARVPDLSDVDSRIRPLLAWMLQPKPEDRPESMVAVAAWRPTRRRGGAWAAAVGVAIMLASLGGAGYVFCSDIEALLEPAPHPASMAGAKPAAPGAGEVVDTSKPSEPPPPVQTPAAVEPPRPAETPTAIEPPRPAETPTAVETPRPVETPTAVAPPPAETPTAVETPRPAETPTAVETPAPAETPPPVAAEPPKPPETDGSSALSDLLEDKPRAPQAFPTLPPGYVGSPYRAEIPAFEASRPAKLRLAASPPPDGLQFHDRGNGVGVIDGVPKQSGTTTVVVTATNERGESATITLVVVVFAPFVAASSPTPAPEPEPAVATLPGARVGQDYSADLPPSSLPDGLRASQARIEPAAPPGLRVIDSGDGNFRLAGRPTRAGDFQFDVVASAAGGAEARARATLDVAAAQPPAPARDVGEFLRAYDSGDCVFARSLEKAIGGKTVEVVSADPDAFGLFTADFRKSIGEDPRLLKTAVDGAVCPALQLLKIGRDGFSAPPRIELRSRNIGQKAPLAGRVSGLAGRSATLLLIKNNGFSVVVPQRPSGPDVATFELPSFKNAPEDLGHALGVLAIVSDKPLSAFTEMKNNQERGLQINELVGKLLRDWVSARAAADLRFVILSP